MLDSPDDGEFEAWAEEAVESLPPELRRAMSNLAIVIEEEATPEQLATVRAHGLYGLYQGVPRTAFSADAAPIPSKITIFRGPLVRANPTSARLAAAVADTVYHEIAHHLGISDARLHELARERAAGG